MKKKKTPNNILETAEAEEADQEQPRSDTKLKNRKEKEYVFKVVNNQLHKDLFIGKEKPLE